MTKQERYSVSIRGSIPADIIPKLSAALAEAVRHPQQTPKEVRHDAADLHDHDKELSRRDSF